VASPRVLVVDATGRGHALCDLFVRTDPAVQIYYGPGSNAVRHDRIVPVPEIALHDAGTVIDFCRHTSVEFVLVSYIDSLVAGFIDELRARGILCIGPTRAAAALEASKRRAKRFCFDHGIPTAPFGYFEDPNEAKAYIRSLPYPVVVKADSLRTVGDGVHVCSDAFEAEAAVDALLAQQHDGHDFAVIVEKRLFGEEISIFALLDGGDYLLFPPARDFKRALDFDRGKNCDGMGSIAPHPFDCPELRAQIRTAIMNPLRRGLRDEGLDFTGFIYAGAIMTAQGLQVLEINARFGDSEAEAVLPGVHTNFTALCRRVISRDLGNAQLATDGYIRCSVAATQGSTDPGNPAMPPGWPFGEFETGHRVIGTDSVDCDRADLFMAGMALDQDKMPVTAGGRVLHVVGRGLSPHEAIHAAYDRMDRISFPGKRCRSDIGHTYMHGWPGRRAWWRDVQWSRCMHRAVSEVCGRGSSPLRRIFADDDHSSSECLLDSVLIAYFAGEREVDDVIELVRALDPAVSDMDAAFIAVLADLSKSALARTHHDGHRDAEFVLRSELSRTHLSLDIRAHRLGGHGRRAEDWKVS
jgi:phosphoribosylamine---glycine ligase